MNFIYKKLRSVAILLAALLVSSCNSDDVTNDSYYTFTGESVATFCENRPSNFSVFSQIITEAGLSPLLSTYGHYTAFIPTDEAYKEFFAETGLSLESMTQAEKADMVYNHIIRSTTIDYMTKDFSSGALATPNMNNRYMVISYEQAEEDGQTQIFVNKNSRLLNYDIELHNGVVHVVDKVLVPSDETLGSLLNTVDECSLFAEALELTHMTDSMAESYDMNYISPYSSEFVIVRGYTMKPLQQKKLGYTLFVEPDEVLNAAGINNLDQLVAYAENFYGTEDRGDYTSRRNALNKFVSYHILDRQMSTNALIYSGPFTTTNAMDKRHEYYETMLQYRLMEIKAGNKINTLADGTHVAIDESRSNISGMNGFIHILKNILVYDEDNMRNDVLNKRIRIDAYAIPPQLTNNNIRWQLNHLDGFGGFTMSPDYCGDHFKLNDESDFIMWSSEGWSNYQADEMSIRGWYDFTLRLPPVPPGTYEIRLGYTARPWGGIAQIFVDGDIVGIPANFNATGDSPAIGWVADAETRDNGDENDKMMRNRGYMKAPNSIYVPNGGKVLRDHIGALRKIIGQFTWQEYGPHYFRAKNVESEAGEFHLDYFELVPTSYLDEEGKD